MENNHKLCLYVSYYLARFNNLAIENLGYSNWNIAFEDIGFKLSVKPHSVKNWRDEFDPLFGHRAGWHQRPMTPSRARVANALQDLEEIQIRSIVKDIISGSISDEPETEEQLLNVASEKTDKDKRRFILRAPTGKAAEEYFIKHHSKTSSPFEGELIDCRDLGCGYDFEIVGNHSRFFIEVKGNAEVTGGILFTDKEWRTAEEKKDKYILCIVKNIAQNPEINFVINPFARIKPERKIYTTIQINWTLSQKELSAITDD